jgi:23S rRNA pseudouridine1911/1915/1917 synthase
MAAYSEILFEDNHLIAVNKIGGALVQADRTNDAILPDEIKNYLKTKYDKPGNVYLGTVHRIDRPVSGLVLFGRTSKASARLSLAFRENEIKKTYLAIVKNPPKEKVGHLTLYLAKDSVKNKSSVVNEKHAIGKLSELKYEWLGSKKGMHLIKVNPITGRHHQIRVMLSHIGCPINGDLKYGAFPANENGNISLHAYKIELIHPVHKEKITIIAEPPQQKDWDLFKDLLPL